ncbi:regulator of Vps4 activity in the MVB pathway-domain-containing protein [Panaeolus papilionaceus]|nr:regulator of Vps4 activity in the MVB pathway-domain-containing protein [Panaeolus papilionaceus]
MSYITIVHRLILGSTAVGTIYDVVQHQSLNPLRLSVQRLRTLQQKKEAQAKASRREIATLVEKGKIETAKIKTEAIIHEDIYVELLEILELYCELLVARFGLLDQNTREPDPGVAEGVCSVIHAAPRTELKELHILRDILMHKYGREYSLAAIENRNGCVSPRVTSKMTVGTPSPTLVDAYLKEIAKAYGVPWSTPGEEADTSEAEVVVRHPLIPPFSSVYPRIMAYIACRNPRRMTNLKTLRKLLRNQTLRSRHRIHPSLQNRLRKQRSLLQRTNLKYWHDVLRI